MSTVLEQVARLSSAEEIFASLDVPFEPRVLHVARLHILRRMRDHLEALPPDASREAVRDCLVRAYRDFVDTPPIERRVFRVLQEAARPAGRAFVPLSALTQG